MRKFLITLGVIAVASILIYSQRATLVERLLERGMPARMGADRMAELGDGLHMVLCGAGGPMPAPRASGPCVAVIAGDQLFVVDAGTDGVRNLGRMNIPVARIKGVLLTHFHSDHIDGLGEIGTMRWAAGDHTTPLPVHGPRGVERVVAGFNTAYGQDFNYRHDHHGDTVAPMSGAGLTPVPFEPPAMSELHVVQDEDGLKIEALAVEHLPVSPTVGYRFTYKGRTLLITGDTIKSDNIQRFSQDIDLLVHEALAPNLVMMMNSAAKSIGNPIMEKITFDILDYHASPVQAAETARDANVGHLVYYHIVPPMLLPGQEALWLDGADEVFADYTVGYDGIIFSLPPESDEIIKVSDGL